MCRVSKLARKIRTKLDDQARDCLHSDVVCVCLLGSDTDRVAARTTCRKDSLIVRTQNEGVGGGISEVLRLGRPLVHIISKI